MLFICIVGGYIFFRIEFGVLLEFFLYFDIVSEKLRKKNMGGERCEYGRIVDF